MLIRMIEYQAIGKHDSFVAPKETLHLNIPPSFWKKHAWRAWDLVLVQSADGSLGFGRRAVCQNGRAFAHPSGFDLKLRGLRGLEGKRVALEDRVGHVGKQTCMSWFPENNSREFLLSRWTLRRVNTLIPLPEVLHAFTSTVKLLLHASACYAWCFWHCSGTLLLCIAL